MVKAQMKFRDVIIAILLLLLGGTIFYHFHEGWAWIDSLYFTSVIMLTIGSGKLEPTTTLSKIFTIHFAFFAISIFFFSVAVIVKAERDYIRRKFSTITKEIEEIEPEKKSTIKKKRKKKTKWLLFN